MNNNHFDKIELIPATLADYPTIQNLARFYVYDRTKFMGWSCPENGLFECIDFKHYFENEHEKAFLIRVDNEIAGFVLLDKMRLLQPVDCNMGEFFVVAKFQGKGVADSVALQILRDHPGLWSVAVMPDNIKAVKFWRKIISRITNNNYFETFKTEDELRTEENPDPYDMIIFTFNINTKDETLQENHITKYSTKTQDCRITTSLSSPERRPSENANIELIPAPLEAKETIKNLARFYVYELSPYKTEDDDSGFPENRLYEARESSFEFEKYWKKHGYFPFLIHVNNELAGFVLVNNQGSSEKINWFLSEFFILAKFQGKGVGRNVALQIFNLFKGSWEITQLLTNVRAIHFWQSVINEFTKGHYIESREVLLNPKPHEMVIQRFQNK